MPSTFFWPLEKKKDRALEKVRGMVKGPTSEFKGVLITKTIFFKTNPENNKIYGITKYVG